MYSFKESNRSIQTPAHKCQIDCTNHDEVINNLEIKSKDLYFFWVLFKLMSEKLRMALQSILFIKKLD